MKIKKIFHIKEQSTCETCLAICLIALIRKSGLKVRDSEEVRILLEGIKFTKLDYSIGHLTYCCKKFSVNIEAYIEFFMFKEKLSKLNLPKNLKLISEKINKKFIQKMTQDSPVIVYINKFYLEKIFHYPHFIIVISLDDKNAKIFDPWDGKYRNIPTPILIKSIASLRNKLRISPKLIRLVS